MENAGKFNEKSHRINQIREYFCDGNNKLFAEKIGISTTQASNLCGGKVNIGEKSLYKILLAFPEVSKEWLFKGKGQMLSTSTPASEGRAKAERSYSEGTPEQVAILRALLEDKERKLAEANQLIGKLRLQLQLEREKTPSLSAQTETESILP